MNKKEAYSAYMDATNTPGSNKAGSYKKALDLLALIMSRKSINDVSDFWSIDSPKEIADLYDFALQHQSDESGVFQAKGLPPSYGANRFYSAALKSYGHFLWSHQLDQIYEQSSLTSKQIGKKLEREHRKAPEIFLYEPTTNREGQDTKRETNARLGQDYFRKMILREYRGACCVTGLDIASLLRASHISSWASDKANRLNPANGLCLSATYDAAFDKHLISFDDDYRMVVSPVLAEHYNKQTARDYFQAFEGMKISMPMRHPPDLELLKKHREKLAT